MAFDLFRFIFGRSIVENQGVPRDRATQLAVLPAALDVPLVESVLLSTVIGRSNAQAEPTPNQVPVPDVVGTQLVAAQSALTDAGFTLGGEEFVTDGDVSSQSPEGGALANAGSPVKLFVFETGGDGGGD
jgi:hypothetical protein